MIEKFPELRAKCLIVEDSRTCLEYFHLMVGSDTIFDFSHAKNLTETLSLLQKEEFQLILLDLQLPDSSPKNTLEVITKTCQFTPIIVISSVDDEIIQENAFALGVQDYLIKGIFTKEDFIHAAKQAIRRCLNRNDIFYKLQNLERQILDHR